MTSWKDLNHISTTIIDSRNGELTDIEEFIAQHYDVPPNFLHHYKCKVIDLCSLYWAKQFRDPGVFLKIMDNILQHEEIRHEYIDELIQKETDPDYEEPETQDYPLELEM